MASSWKSFFRLEIDSYNYLMLDNASALKRHTDAFQQLEHQVQQLNQLARNPQQRSSLAKLQTLIEQRKVLAKQTIILRQSKPTVTPQQIQLNHQLHQNRLAITTVLTQIQTQEEQLLQNRSQQANLKSNYHIHLELFGTALIFTLLFGAYRLLFSQILKCKDAEVRQQHLAQENALNELKINLFSLLSHEFRTPLSIILGATQLLANTNQPWSEAKRRKNLDRIQSSARSMNQLLTDILTLARAESGKLECHLTTLDLESFCLDLIDEIQLTTAPDRRLEFISQANFSYAMLDEALLHHIFSNLLSNALKYSPADSLVALTLRTEPDTVIFQVHDEGSGIAAADQPHLYEPFQRGHNSGKTPGAGLG
jgi:signal transduction histidine kinase